MKDTMTLIALIGVMFYQNWKLTFFALIMMPLFAAGVAKSQLEKESIKQLTEAGKFQADLLPTYQKF